MKTLKPFLLTAIFLLCANSVFACPGCSQLLENGKDAFKAMLFGRGIAWSMVLMFSVPALLVGSFAFMLWRSTRRNTDRRGAGPS